jgi:protocatechuate 4,5-dioxygenase alpha chain
LYAARRPAGHERRRGAPVARALEPRRELRDSRRRTVEARPRGQAHGDEGGSAMGNVDKVDKTLPLNEMMFYVRKDAELRRRFVEDLPALAREFGLSAEELDALQQRDVRRLNDMGVHQYYLPQILRLVFGTKSASNAHPAMEAFKRAYPEEFARAQAAQARR